MKPCRPILFAKLPQAGVSKTRLIPALGAAGAAQLAGMLFRHTLAKIQAATIGEIELCLSPAVAPQWQELGVTPALACHDQGAGDLGLRMARACKRALDEGFAPLLMGTDCPECSVDDLRSLAQALQTHDAVIAPAADGGYPVIGLQRWHASVFEGLAWSTATVYDDTQSRFAALGWRVYSHRLLHDIDEPADLKWLPQGWPEAGREG